MLYKDIINERKHRHTFRLFTLFFNHPPNSWQIYQPRKFCSDSLMKKNLFQRNSFDCVVIKKKSLKNSRIHHSFIELYSSSISSLNHVRYYRWYWNQRKGNFFLFCWKINLLHFSVIWKCFLMMMMKSYIVVIVAASQSWSSSLLLLLLLDHDDYIHSYNYDFPLLLMMMMMMIKMASQSIISVKMYDILVDNCNW